MPSRSPEMQPFVGKSVGNRCASPVRRTSGRRHVLEKAVAICAQGVRGPAGRELAPASAGRRSSESMLWSSPETTKGREMLDTFSERTPSDSDRDALDAYSE